MKPGIKISKKLAYRLMLLMALMASAIVFDIYFEQHPGALTAFSTEDEQETKEPGVVYLISQTGTFTVKSHVQNVPGRKVFTQAHSKYLQHCHQIRDRLALKAEQDVPRTPVWRSCHNLLFRQHYFSLPDDEPLIS